MHFISLASGSSPAFILSCTNQVARPALKEGHHDLHQGIRNHYGRGGYIAIPFDMEGGTFDEAVAMVADWLRMQTLDALLHGHGLPGGGTGHDPREGRRVVAVAVDASLSDAPAVTAAQAAGVLGVSTARVAQMCASGQLASWKVGGTRMVAVESIEERLASSPRPGRPRREDRELAMT